MSVWSTFLVVPYLSLTRRKLILTQISCFSCFFQISENVSITSTDEFSYQLTSEGKRNHFCALNLFCSVICHVSHTEPDRNPPAREWWTVMGFLLLNAKIWISNSKHRCLSYYQAVLPHQAFLILVIFFCQHLEFLWRTTIADLPPETFSSQMNEAFLSSFCELSKHAISIGRGSAWRMRNHRGKLPMQVCKNGFSVNGAIVIMKISCVKINMQIKILTSFFIANAKSVCPVILGREWVIFEAFLGNLLLSFAG